MYYFSMNFTKSPHSMSYTVMPWTNRCRVNCPSVYMTSFTKYCCYLGKLCLHLRNASFHLSEHLACLSLFWCQYIYLPNNSIVTFTDIRDKLLTETARSVDSILRCLLYDHLSKTYASSANITHFSSFDTLQA